MAQELPSFVVEAIAQRQLYNTREDFLAARDLAKALGGDPGKTLDGMLVDFLGKRKIKHDTPPEELAQMSIDDVRLLGATYYSGRKLFSTSYEVNGGTDPAPLIQNVFDSLLVSDNANARAFLEGMAGVSSKVVENQRKVVGVIDDVLKVLTVDYKKAVSEMDTKHKRGTRQYETELAKIAANHRFMLDEVIAYANEVQTNEHHEPSLRGFKNFVGTDGPTNGGGTVNRIDANYIDSLIRTHGRDYDKMIKQMEAEVGPIAGMDKNASIERATVKLVIYTGKPESPTRYVVSWAKGSVTGQQIGLMYAMRNYALAKTDLTQDMRTKTLAFENVIKHLGGS